ncbi:DUF5060 domain-containing protein [Pseudonocardia cypriaca]|uniref:Uncharacterized protein DUF4038 n=1 Tax=Pseudonocardia cypriaca TaxID=882449 RepID=A0A543GBH1_9PSEU|nr:DUF5060 domain-containing protein [Pseudonocardia cypriaca]TQM43419.1 uncharacterized protein DUF4038 [Pseudonocardia cypriaca]
MIERWGVFEARFPGSEAAAVEARFTHGDRAVRVPGFYDGDGTHVVRFSPDAEGEWSYSTTSGDAELDGRTGTFEVGPPSPRNHGPVGVAGTFHFAYADGTPYRPVGTTVYNWAHQPEDHYRETLESVAAAGFTKLRFLVFPQGGNHVGHVPDAFPFARDGDRWDVSRIDAAFFRRIDRAVRDLLDVGVQADVILFHPYDGGRFGLDGLTAEQDEVYLRHLVARLSAYRNVWWSLANEYDILDRPDERWDGVFRTLRDADPHTRLRSIHNWIRLYDHNKPWVTHVSLQNGSAVADFGRALLYRDTYRRPIVLDEIKYEGDTAERWGNLSARELVHRFWIATVSGTYASHGESYLVDGGTLSIVAGGRFRGESPPRLAFLRRILEEVDGAGLDPIDKWDDPTNTAGIPRQVYLQYLGLDAPPTWTFRLPQGVVGERLQVGDRFAVDVIDTWNTTVEPVGREFTLTSVERNDAWADGEPVALPAGEALALRIRRIDG